MQLRAASEHDVTQLARLMGGDPSQASTAAAMRRFDLDSFTDVIEVNRVMMESTGGWRHVTVADMEGPVGFIAVGEPFLSMTPEIVELCMRLYGEGFASIIGPRLAALQRVQSTYPPESRERRERGWTDSASRHSSATPPATRSKPGVSRWPKRRTMPCLRI